MNTFKKNFSTSVLAMTLTVTSFSALAMSNLQFPAFNKDVHMYMTQQKMDGIVVITKEGCPVCRKQVSALKNILNMPELDNIIIQQVNYADPIAKSKFKAHRQSIIIIYQDGEEKERLVGVTDKKAIERAIKAAL